MRDALCDEVDTGDLLEALDDDAEGSTTEVLARALREDLAQRRARRAFAFLDGDGLADTEEGVLHRGGRVLLVLEGADDGQAFLFATLASEPSW